MKIKIGNSVKIPNFLILILTVLAVSSCQQNQNLSKEISAGDDCSTVFSAINTDEANNNSQCKVLSLQISAKIKCEISSSNKVDNLLNSYTKNPGDEIIFMAQLEALKNLAGDVSFKDKIKFYFLVRKIQDSIDSDLFDSLKDFRYKGMSCVIDGNKFTSWISSKDVIIIYEEDKKTDTKKSTKKARKVKSSH